jgi:oligosaccharyltransferase complex subunit gamma
MPVPQVNALPCAVRIPPDMPVGGSTLELRKSDKMLPDTVGSRNYPWPAEMFVEFMGSRHGLSAAAVDRPNFYKSPLFGVLVVAGLLAAVYLAYKVYALSLLQHSAIWAVLSLAVFWFSVSGGMYNIIRGVPFFIRDRQGNLQVRAWARELLPNARCAPVSRRQRYIRVRQGLQIWHAIWPW